MNITNEQAFGIIAQVVNAHLCNKQDRMTLDVAMQAIAKLVQDNPSPPQQDQQSQGGMSTLPPPTR